MNFKEIFTNSVSRVFTAGSNRTVRAWVLLLSALLVVTILSADPSFEAFAEGSSGRASGADAAARDVTGQATDVAVQGASVTPATGDVTGSATGVTGSAAGGTGGAVGEGEPATTSSRLPAGYPLAYGAFTASDAWFTPAYGAFTTRYTAKMYLPGTKILRVQAVRPYLDRTKPMVALTFDDGPAQYTERIVALLREYGCRATFCVLGDRVRPQKKRVRLIAAQGSELVGHSWDHKNLTKLSKKKVRAELKKTNDAIRAITGVQPTMHRPPYGAFDKTVLKISKKQKLALLTWSVDTYDWKLRDSKKLFEVIKKSVKPDQIILMHDIHEQTAESMKLVIPWLIEQGYQPVTVSELFYYRGIKVKPGKVYNDGVNEKAAR
ncbi:MAG: polysaccharide deacetylase family protein [Clostridiales Family XIII bacterium]|jgi:peptidoglycan/xylan/chitin deacetylase (PgdA/CDA1 family)|nr:polysaccharide deacetylase family protein [Clostridiales Family XIII bacterium]